jgi:hypothetical protein
VPRTPHYIGLMLNYFYLKKIESLTALYLKLKSNVGDDEIVELIKQHAPNNDIAMGCVGMCKKLLQQS